MVLLPTIKAVIGPGEQSGYLAEWMGIPVVTQGEALDEVSCNLKEAIEPYSEGKNLASLRLAPKPTIIATYYSSLQNY